MTAAHTVSAVAGQATSLFTHSGGIRAIAANGPVSLQAHTDQLEIMADKEVAVISVSDRIEIKAKEKIVLQAGESSVTLDNGDITFACPGKFSARGSQHIIDKAARIAAELTRLPDSEVKLFDEAFVLLSQATGLPLSHVSYRVRHEDGSYDYGSTDEQGRTHLITTNASELLTIEVKT
jgi:type VI secretion system secreted protein VgrG